MTKKSTALHGVDIKNIDPLEGMDVAIHVHVTEADVQWEVKE